MNEFDELPCLEEFVDIRQVLSRLYLNNPQITTDEEKSPEEIVDNYTY